MKRQPEEDCEHDANGKQNDQRNERRRRVWPRPIDFRHVEGVVPALRPDPNLGAVSLWWARVTARSGGGDVSDPTSSTMEEFRFPEVVS